MNEVVRFARERGFLPVVGFSDRPSYNRLDGRVIGSVLRNLIAAWETPVS